MKKIFLLILGFVMFKVGYSQYPIQQFIGADSAVVTSKGGLQGRFINVVFADTTAANSQRVRQYPGAMIYASGKLWVRNTTATGWTELAYGPITPVNIYNSDGTITGPRTLDGNNDDLTFDNMAYFTVNGNPLGQIRFYQGSNSNILMRGDTTAISRRLSYTGNLGSSFTKHTVVDKNYVDSTVSANSVNIYNSDGTLTGDRTLSGGNYELSFNNISILDLNANNSASISQGSQYLQLMGDTGIFAKRVSYNSNLGSTFKKHTLVDKNYVDSSITASPSGTVTSVGLSMPTAFAVANSPVTSSGTLTVTGAGVASQYIRGDGQLATLPNTGGGGSSVSYYLNGSVNQGTFGGTPYYEMSKTAIFGAGTDFTISSNGYIASFITDANDPALLKIPGGNWNLELYFSASSSGGTPSFYVELYKYDGTTFTLIASNSTSPEGITNGTAIDAYFTTLSVPETVLTLTDRLAIRVYVTHSGRTITLHTENSHLCQIITTFSTGINALNGLTSQVQYFATGTSGTDFNISSLTDTHTFNLPTASATNRGALSSADWTTFNNKGSVSSVATNTATGITGGTITTTGTLAIDTNLISTRAWRQKGIDSVASIANGKIGGSGTTNYVSKFTASGTIGNSQIFDNGTNVGIGNTSPSAKLDVTAANGEIRSTGTAATYTQYNAFITSGVNMRIGAYATSNGYLGTTTNHPFTIETNNTEIARFTATGQMGIGTASPASTLEIYKSSGTNYLYVTNGASSSNTGVVLRYNSVDYMGMIGNFFTGELKIGGFNAGSYFMTFYSNNAERMRLTPSGRLLIGTSTESTYELDLVGDFRSTLDANINGLTVGKGLASVAQNTAFGVTALASNTSGNAVTAIGYQAGNANTTSSHNTYIGNQSGPSATGANNTFVGSGSGFANTGGAQNTFLGTFAGYEVTSGTYNTAVGYNTGRSITTGNYNTIIGSQVTGLSSSLSNTIILADGQGNQRLVAFNDGNVYIGGSTSLPTNSGYKLFVNGTAIVKEYLYLLRSDGAASIAALTYQPGNTIDIGNTFRVLGTNRWQNTVSSVSYIENNYFTKVFASVPQTNASWTMYDFQLYSSMNPTIASSYNQKVIGTAFTIQSTAVNSFFGVDVRATDNSSSIANNVYGIYADATLGTNTSSNRWAGYFVGRGYFSGNVGIGTTSPNASALLDITSTTKGFLPPRMTGAQAEAIGTPAAGLMVYSTDGSGATITSLGWWGYNGTTWVKLN